MSVILALGGWRQEDRHWIHSNLKTSLGHMGPSSWVGRAGEMAQKLHLLLLQRTRVQFTTTITLVTGDPVPSSDLCRHRACTWYTDTLAIKQSYTKNKINKLKTFVGLVG